MKYFESLPLISVTENGRSTIYRNIMTRISMIPTVSKNPLVFYEYDVQEGDTPEIVAEKYYGDPYRYWIVLFPNEMLDAQWDWPLGYTQLQKYITDKYTELDIDPYSTIKSYQKVITQYNQSLGTTNTDVVEISESEYDSLIESTKDLNTSDGVLTVVTSKRTQSYYDYEVEKNESKRSIKLLNKEYVAQIETEFGELLKV